MSPGAPIEHLERARRFAGSAANAWRGGYFESATSDAYYAVFHVAQALLATAGVFAETHAGVRTMLGRLYVRDGTLPPEFSGEFARLMSDRQTADYVVEAPVTPRAAARSLREAAGLIRHMLPVLAARAPQLADTLAALTEDADALATLADG